MFSLSWDLQPTGVDYDEFIDTVQAHQIWFRKLGKIGQLPAMSYYVLVFDNIQITPGRYRTGSSDIRFRGGTFSAELVGGSLPSDITPYTRRSNPSELEVVVSDESGIIASDPDRKDRMTFVRYLTPKEIDHITQQLEGV